jgi:hypothetical protein
MQNYSLKLVHMTWRRFINIFKPQVYFSVKTRVYSHALIYYKTCNTTYFNWSNINLNKLIIKEALSPNFSLYVHPVPVCLILAYWKGRPLKTERAELLALIYKGWRKSGRPSFPIIFPIYILRWSPGSSNRKPTRTKAAVRYSNHGSGSERGNRYIAESRPVLLFQRRTDSFLCSFTSLGDALRHPPHHTVTAPDLLAKQVPASIPYRYIRLRPELCSSSERHPVKRHENRGYSCPLSSVFFTATRERGLRLQVARQMES